MEERLDGFDGCVLSFFTYSLRNSADSELLDSDFVGYIIR